MSYFNLKLDQHIKEMKGMAQLLVSYGQSEDDDVSVLKQREIVVDGYTICVHFSRSEHKHDNTYIDIVSFTGKYMPFLPMTFVCKIGEAYLGNKELTFTELLNNGRKYYSWLVLYCNGIPISNTSIKGVCDSYNGLEFTRCKESNTIQF